MRVRVRVRAILAGLHTRSRPCAMNVGNVKFFCFPFKIETVVQIAMESGIMSEDPLIYPQAAGPPP